jgi:hypothetical protein
MSQESTIKAAIKTILDALKTANTLKQVVYDDFKKPVLFRDIDLFPCAIIGPAAITSASETNYDNLRTYEYQVLVVDKVENIASAIQLEDLREAVLNAFDNAPTLAGAANGGLEPSMSRSEPDDGNNYIVFVVNLKAKALYQRT